MKKTGLMIALGLACNMAWAGSGPAWSYGGEDGPEKWGSLAEEYAMCAKGKNQSPIDLKDLTRSRLAPIAFSYQPGGNEIVNNGHTIQVNFTEGSSIMIDHVSFALKQFHFHAPSENLIHGKSFPMEMHLVHADKDGNLAVIGVMFEEGKANQALEKIWPLMPKNKDEKAAIDPAFNAASLLPVKKSYFRFNGSLTTPPCSEGVRWFVMKKPLSASKEQVAEFLHTIHHPNNRPVQPVYARPVLE